MPIVTKSIATAPNDREVARRAARKVLVIPMEAFSASTNQIVFVTTCPIDVYSMQIQVRTTLAADGTNYWRFGLRNITDNQVIVDYTVSGLINNASPITANVAYQSSLHPAVRVVSGKTIVLEVVKAAAAVTTAPGILMVEYEEAEAT